MLVYANYFQPSFKMINKKQERASRDQGPQSASHALRPHDPALFGQRRSENSTG